MKLEKLSKKELGCLLTVINDESIKDEIRNELLSRSENEKIKCYRGDSNCTKPECGCEKSKCGNPECGCECEESKCACEKENVDNYKYYLYIQELDSVTHDFYGITIYKTDGTNIKFKSVRLKLSTKTLSNYTEFESNSSCNFFKIKDEDFKNFIETSKEDFDIADKFLTKKVIDVDDNTLSKLKDLFYKDKKVIYPKGTILMTFQDKTRTCFVNNNLNDKSIIVVRLLDDVYDLNKLCKCRAISFTLSMLNNKVTNVNEKYSDQEYYKIDESFIKLNSETIFSVPTFLTGKKSSEKCENFEKIYMDLYKQLYDILTNFLGVKDDENINYNDNEKTFKKEENNISKTKDVDVTYKYKHELFDDMFKNIDTYITYYNELFRKLSKI